MYIESPSEWGFNSIAFFHFADSMDNTNSYNGNCKRQRTKHDCLQANANDDANVTN